MSIIQEARFSLQICLQKYHIESVAINYNNKHFISTIMNLLDIKHKQTITDDNIQFITKYTTSIVINGELKSQTIVFNLKRANLLIT